MLKQQEVLFSAAVVAPVATNRSFDNPVLASHDVPSCTVVNRRILDNPRAVPPPITTGITVVLDLDETLVDARGPRIWVRPHLELVLSQLRAYGCEVILWSAGEYYHVARCLLAIDPQQEFFDHVVCRGPSWAQSPACKDLHRLQGRRGRCLLVDNSPHCGRLNPSVSIVVPDFVHTHPQAAADTTLLYVLNVAVRAQLIGTALAAAVCKPPHPNDCSEYVLTPTAQKDSASTPDGTTSTTTADTATAAKVGGGAGAVGPVEGVAVVEGGSEEQESSLAVVARTTVEDLRRNLDGDVAEESDVDCDADAREDSEGVPSLVDGPAKKSRSGGTPSLTLCAAPTPTAPRAEGCATRSVCMCDDTPSSRGPGSDMTSESVASVATSALPPAVPPVAKRACNARLRRSAGVDPLMTCTMSVPSSACSTPPAVGTPAAGTPPRLASPTSVQGTLPALCAVGGGPFEKVVVGGLGTPPLSDALRSVSLNSSVGGGSSCCATSGGSLLDDDVRCDIALDDVDLDGDVDECRLVCMRTTEAGGTEGCVGCRGSEFGCSCERVEVEMEAIPAVGAATATVELVPMLDAVTSETDAATVTPTSVGGMSSTGSEAPKALTSPMVSCGWSTPPASLCALEPPGGLRGGGDYSGSDSSGHDASPPRVVCAKEDAGGVDVEDSVTTSGLSDWESTPPLHGPMTPSGSTRPSVSGSGAYSTVCSTVGESNTSRSSSPASALEVKVCGLCGGEKRRHDAAQVSDDAATADSAPVPAVEVGRDASTEVPARMTITTAADSAPSVTTTTTTADVTSSVSVSNATDASGGAAATAASAVATTTTTTTTDACTVDRAAISAARARYDAASREFACWQLVLDALAFDTRRVDHHFSLSCADLVRAHPYLTRTVSDSAAGPIACLRLDVCEPAQLNRRIASYQKHFRTALQALVKAHERLQQRALLHQQFCEQQAVLGRLCEQRRRRGGQAHGSGADASPTTTPSFVVQSQSKFPPRKMLALPADIRASSLPTTSASTGALTTRPVSRSLRSNPRLVRHSALDRGTRIATVTTAAAPRAEASASAAESVTATPCQQVTGERAERSSRVVMKRAREDDVRMMLMVGAAF